MTIVSFTAALISKLLWEAKKIFTKIQKLPSNPIARNGGRHLATGMQFKDDNTNKKLFEMQNNSH
jgi:hypothetical protein